MLSAPQALAYLETCGIDCAVAWQAYMAGVDLLHRVMEYAEAPSRYVRRSSALKEPEIDSRLQEALGPQLAGFTVHPGVVLRFELHPR